MLHRILSTSAVIAAAVSLSFAFGGAQAVAGPFDGMAGNWSGDGRITMASGSGERLRCRSSNSIGQGGNSLDISIRCASDSYKIDLSGYMINSNGSISGKWSEPNYNSAGSVSGRASGNGVNVIAVGNTFSARMSMTGSGGRLSVTIRPEATEIRNVSLSFRKR
jgi:hypothetical protein